MKIITRAVFDITQDDIPIIEEESFDYIGTISECKSGGSSPQPVDPYAQAAAQYGLSTGTANYNARLNRTNQQNALGSSSWDITGYDNSGAPFSYQNTSQNSSTGPQSGSTTSNSSDPQAVGHAGLFQPSQGSGGFGNSFMREYPQYSPTIAQTPAPIYTQTTRLAPQFESQLEKPIDTSGIAGMPGGPSTTQDLQDTRNALYQQQMQYLAPEQALQSEQNTSNLANMGATIGSPAWNNEQDRLGREQELARSNAATQAIAGGGAEQSRLFGMGSQSLQDQIAARNAPISEYNALLSPQSASATAMTPDISGAFNQQYQGALNSANQQTATDNANTSAAGSLLSSYLMYLALA